MVKYSLSVIADHYDWMIVRPNAGAHYVSTYFYTVPDYDATGKVSSGVLGGATSWLGDYYQCLGLPHSQYCLMQMFTDPPQQPHVRERERQQ